MSRDTHPAFRIECPNCDVTYESDRFEETSKFAEKHEDHTDHIADWVRADFEFVELEMQWRVLCMECEDAWQFETEDEAHEFRKEHAEYTDHEVGTSIKEVEIEPPEIDEVEDQDSVKKLIEQMELQHDKGAPEKQVLAHISEDGTSIAEARHELRKLKRRGEVYEPRTGYLRTT